MDEKIFYNAVALAAQGDYQQIAKWRAGHATWAHTYADARRAWLAADNTLFGDGGVGGGGVSDRVGSARVGEADEAREQRKRMLLIDPPTEWQKLEKLGVRLILLDDAVYPPLLREIPHPPFGIYVLGELGDVARDAKNNCTASAGLPLSLSIVGTRRATPEGKKIAQQFGRELAQAGFTIVSGLAFGVDAAAHAGFLEGAKMANVDATANTINATEGGTIIASAGRAIAVLAGGLDNISPHSNEPLARRILAAGGAIVSEYPIGEPPYDYRFLERNRIVSGLSRGTLIIEAPERSGSLATARYAFEQNRDLFVVPGPVAHPNFAASHELIRQGATLVTKPEHIMEAYGMEVENGDGLRDKSYEVRKRKKMREDKNTSPEEKLVLDALRGLAATTGGAAEVDKLADMTRLEPQAVNQAITFLTIKNLIKEVAGGYIIE